MLSRSETRADGIGNRDELHTRVGSPMFLQQSFLMQCKIGVALICALAFGGRAVRAEEPVLRVGENSQRDQLRSVAPADVPWPTERFKSFAALPPSGSGLRVKLDDRRWVELNSLATSGSKIDGRDLKVFWKADGELIDPPADFDPLSLVPSLEKGEMPDVTREANIQIVAAQGSSFTISSGGRGGFGRFSVPVNKDFVQFPIQMSMSNLGYNHTHVEVRVTQQGWEDLPLAGGNNLQVLINEETRRLVVVAEQTRAFAWRCEVQYDAEEPVEIGPFVTGVNLDSSFVENVRDAVLEGTEDHQAVVFALNPKKPMPMLLKLQRSRYDVVRFDNLAVYPGPRSAVKVSVNGWPLRDGDQATLTDAVPHPQAKSEPDRQPTSGGDDSNSGIVILKGQVVDRNNNPVPNCWVGMFQNPQIHNEGKSPESEFDAGPLFSGAALSDADGRFTITAIRNHFVFDGSLWAVGPHGSAGVKALNATWKHSRNQLKITLTGEVGLVRVIDPDGHPVPEAEVRLTAVRLPRSVTHEIPVRVQQQQQQMTDEDGRAFFRGWASAGIRGLEVSADGFGTQFLSERLASQWVEGDAPLAVTLRPTAKVSGRVDNFDPVQHADLRLQMRTESWEGPKPPLYGKAVVPIRDDGTFTINTIAAGRVSLVSSLPPDSAHKIRYHYIPALEPGEERTIEPANNPDIERGVIVRQQIIKSDTGEGIPELTMRVLWGSAVENSGSWRQSKHTRTDENGWWTATVLAGEINARINGLPEGYRGTAWFDGRNGRLGVSSFIPATDKVVTLPPERYVPSKQLSGRLQFADGSPAADWSVYGHPISWNDVGVGGVRTKKDGTFTWTYPTGYPPRLYHASNRQWTTEHRFTDRYVVPNVVSQKPFVLQIPEPEESTED